MIFVDAHVHLHPCFNWTTTLNAAVKNFERAGCTGQNSSRFLLLTESYGDCAFETILSHATKGGGVRGWRIRPTEETLSLKVTCSTEQELILVAGRQIVTAEGLEVLALGCRNIIDDGPSVVEAIETVRAAGALPVIPWGFGKWVGRRGQVLDDYLRRKGHRKPLFLGDNGNRIRHLPQPKWLRWAQDHGVTVLPGSDPLPFRSEQTKPGSFGFLLQGRINPDKPMESLTTILSSSPPLTNYGKLETPWKFLVNQGAMQWHKLKARRVHHL
jgi:hypothetical protein